MESNWAKRFLYENGQKRVRPIVFVFIAIQVLLLLVVIANIIQLNDDGGPIDDLERYKRLPELAINNLSNQAQILSDSEVENIQKKVFKIVSENSSDINTREIKAVIREGSLFAKDFNGRTKYARMIIDIPSIEQSYEVFYSSNAVIDPEVSTYALCLNNDADVVYKNFKCTSSDKESIRQQIVETYLNYFGFEYFSAGINPVAPKTIIISPSVSYNNDEKIKTRYINEVKNAIDSLGIPSSSYEYYVRTAADVNYDNNNK